MRILKFNESSNNLQYEDIDFFDLILEKLKSYNGYAVFEISKEEMHSKLFKFDTKEEFEKNFEIKKHLYYPGNMVIPINKIDGDYNCLINGEKFYIDEDNLYLVIKGKLSR